MVAAWLRTWVLMMNIEFSVACHTERVTFNSICMGKANRVMNDFNIIPKTIHYRQG